MKFVALVSGGKDSLYAILESIRNGHELVACAHLAPRRPPNSGRGGEGGGEKEEEEESYMYQTAASECIPTLVEECLGVPLIVRECRGRSKDTSLVYDHAGRTQTNSSNDNTSNDVDGEGGLGNDGRPNEAVTETEAVTDEVEDLHALLLAVLSTYPSITAVTSGAILSTYQRTRIESVCDRLSLTPLSYLWRVGPQRSLLECMLDDGIDAVLVKVASPPGLVPSKHLNKTLAELHYGGLFDRLKERFDFHVCGEGGEYETLVLDCPIYKRRLVLDEVRAVETEDGVGVLRVVRCHAEDKGEDVDDLDEESWRDARPLHVRVREKDAERDDGGGAFGRGDNDDDDDDDSGSAAAAGVRGRSKCDDTERQQQQHQHAERQHGAAILTAQEEQSTMTLPSCSSHSVRRTDGEGRSLLHRGGTSGGVYDSFGTMEDVSGASGGSSTPPSRSSVTVRHLPHVKALPGGLVHISEILSQTVVTLGRASSDDNNHDDDSEADLAVAEAMDVLSTLRHTLSHLPFDGTTTTTTTPATPQDVVYVHLYLSDIAHFAQINVHYRNFFGTVLPPSRSCVAVGFGKLPGGRRVMLDCLVQRGSGRYMRPLSSNGGVGGDGGNGGGDDGAIVESARANPHHPLRSTLHVQSMSHWAPVCVGPYSQSNTVRGGLTFLAGQIGLVPATMQLVGGGWTGQLGQSWTNAASVLDAQAGGGGTLGDCLVGLVYLSTDVVVGGGDCGVDADTVWKEAEELCRSALGNNGGVVAGYVDETGGIGGGVDGEERFGGYEDEGTWREMEGEDAVSAENGRRGDPTEHGLPLLMIALPQMPVGAVAEVELICASSRASSCFGCSFFTSKCDDSVEVEGGSLGSEERIEGLLAWDTGHDGDKDPVLKQTTAADDASMTINSSIGYVGKGCAAVACTTASCARPTTAEEDISVTIDTERVVGDMIESALGCIEEQAGLDMAYTLHVRLYYTISGDGNDDGTHLRCALKSVLNFKWASLTRDRGRKQHAVPASTVVPVSAMRMSSGRSASTSGGNNGGGGGALLFAMQVMAVDLVHTETDMWIHHGRSYD